MLLFLIMLKQLVRNAANHFGYHLTVTPVTNTPIQQRAAFVHIGKCGGSAIDHALRKALATSSDNRLCRDTSIAASIGSFGRDIKTLEDQCEFGHHHLTQLQGLMRYFLSLERGYISGHWGLNRAILDEYRQVQFITVLRDPVARLKSNYIFNKLTNNLKIMPPTNHPTDDLIAEADAIIFGERGWQMANTQSAFIYGHYPKSMAEAKDNHNLFIENLELFALVGFLDNLASFRQRFEHKFSRQLAIEQQNSTQAQVSSANQHTVDILSEYFNSKKIKTHLTKLCEQEKINIDVAREKFE